MKLAKQLLLRLFSGNTPVIILFVLLLASLYLMSNATYNSTKFSQLFSLLIGINLLATFFLVGLIGKNVIDLVKQYRLRTTGSLLRVKLVIMFIILSVTPVTVVYTFSLDYIKRGIDSWFNVQIDNALHDALELSKSSLDIRMRELVKVGQSYAVDLSSLTDELASLRLNGIRNDSNATEVTLFKPNGLIISSSSDETKTLLPMRLDERSSSKVKQGQSDVRLIKDAGLNIRISVPVANPDPVSESRVLQMIFPVSERINQLTETVQSAFGQYKELSYLRKPLKYSFILTLSLVLLLSALTAIWAAFFYAGRMVAPITNLVHGTQAVAKGEYDTRLPIHGNDELNQVIRSFNDMTRQLERAQFEAENSQQQLEASHSYLQGVLANLTSGVLTLDHQHLLITSNNTANLILNLELLDYIDQSLEHIVDDHTHLYTFLDAVAPHLEANDDQWHEEVTLFAAEGRQVIMCRGTTLPDGGYVIVFDDITASLQSQRDAAWGEVARRLAHEIKNPLTPIQLSAERLRHKFLHTMDPKDAEVLDRATHTIVQQVETLKEMVKAFSNYARMPALSMQALSLNSMIEEVLELYQSSDISVNINTELDSSMPTIEADAGRMRQLLHNLIKNALEAMENTENASLTITTQCAKQAECLYVEIRMEDNGPGIPREIYGNLFDPYVTSKVKGSGLGLAIVKKIVEEHGGVLWAENLKTGACMYIRLPVLGEAKGKRPFEKDHNLSDNHDDKQEPNNKHKDDSHAA